MKIVVREAGLDDAALIADLTRRAWAKTAAMSVDGPRETEAAIRADLQQGGSFILTIEGSPAGCVSWLPEGENGEVWKIHHMGVLPEYRGQGLSEHLLEAVIHHAHISDIRELQMALLPGLEELVDYYAVFDFNEAPELEFSLRSEAERPPVMLRKFFD